MPKMGIGVGTWNLEQRGAEMLVSSHFLITIFGPSADGVKFL